MVDVVDRAQQARQKAGQRPIIRVWDAGGALRGYVEGEISAQFEFVLNDVGDGKIELPADHHLARWSLELPTDAVFSVTVDDPDDMTNSKGVRWSGIIDSVEMSTDDDGYATVVWNLVHDFIFMKSILCWSNPETSLATQFPKSCVMVGPSRWVIKQYLFRNLRRLYFSSFWDLASEIPAIFDKNHWNSQSQDRSPVYVVPHDANTDKSVWCVLSSRFTNFYDLVKPTLEDGMFWLKVWRWIPGDPVPAEGYKGPTKMTICVDVIDQFGKTDCFEASGWWGGIVKTGARVINNGHDWDWVWERITNPGVSDTKAGPNDRYYHIPVYRRGSHLGFEGVPGSGMTIKKPTAWKVVNGGKSPDIVNKGINSLIDIVIKVVANALGFGLAADAVAGVVKGVADDTLLAFASAESNRKDTMGFFGRPEHWVSDGQTAFSIEGLQARRVGLMDTRGTVSYKAKVQNAEPWVVGQHFFLGDRVGFEIDTGVWVSRVSSIKMAWDRDRDVEWDVTVGNDEVYELPEARVMKRIEQVKAAIESLGLQT